MLFGLLVSGTPAHSENHSLPSWTADGGKPWTPPDDGVVRDSKAAISIAHAVWISMHPNLADRAGSEELWQTIMIGRLRDGVWEVTSRRVGAGIGGGLFFYIAKSDGQILSIVLTQ